MSGQLSNKTTQSILTDGTNVVSVSAGGALSTDATLSYGEESVLNTTTTPLGSGATYTGTYEQNDYPDVMISCQTDNSGTLYFDFSVDGTNTTTFPVNGFDVANGIHEFHTALKGSRYFRVRLVNDAGAQSYLRLTTYYGAFSKTPNAPLNQSIGPDSDATVTKSVLTGQDGAGTYRTIRCDEEGDLVANIHDPNSAFGELVIADLIAQEQLTYLYNINSDLVASDSLNGGTVTSSNSQLQLSTGTNSAGEASVTSKRLAKYRAGEGIMVRFTAVFTAGVANSIQCIGLFDDNDGFWVGYSGTDFVISRTSAGSDNTTAQASFNIDTLDGNGPSGFTLDPTKGNVYQIQFQWLGYGAITFGVETDDGRIRPFHRINYANTATVPSIRQPSLPLAAFVANTGNTSDIVLNSASMAVFVEGKKTVNGITRGIDSTGATSLTTEQTILVVQNKDQYNGKDNAVPVIPVSLSGFLEGTSNKSGIIRIYKDAGRNGVQSFTDIDVNNSPIEYDTTQNSLNGVTGQLIASYAVGHNESINIDLNNFNLQLGRNSNLTVTTTSGTSHAPDIGLSWIEDH